MKNLHNESIYKNVQSLVLIVSIFLTFFINLYSQQNSSGTVKFERATGSAMDDVWKFTGN